MSSHTQKKDSKLISHALSFVDKVSNASKCKKWVVGVSLFVAHSSLAYLNCNWNWIAAFGGLMTIAGFIMIFGYSLPESGVMKPKNPIIWQGGTPMLDSGGGLSDIVSEDVAESFETSYKEMQSKYDKYIENMREELVSSLYLTIFGTLIWAYAGFL